MMAISKSMQFLVFSVISVLAFSNLAYAGMLSAEKQIRKMSQELSAILNEKSSPDMIKGFLQATISKDASFSMSLAIDGVDGGQVAENVLSRADYIEALLSAAENADQYNVTINVETVETLPLNSGWVSKITFIESGVMKNSGAFTRFTTCDSVYEQEGMPDLVLTRANCFIELYSGQDA